LINGHFKAYKLIQHLFNLPLTPVPQYFQFRYMTNPPSTIEGLDFIFETLKVQPDQYDFEKASQMNSSVTFKYLYQRYPDLSRQVISTNHKVDSIIKNALTLHNIDLVLFLHQQGVNIESAWMNLFHLPHTRECIQFIEILIKTTQPQPTYTYQQIIMDILCRFISGCSDFNLFKLLFNIVEPLINKKGTLMRCIYAAIDQGRLQVIKFFFSIDMVPNSFLYYMIQRSFTNSGSLSILKYFISNHHQDVMKLKESLFSSRQIQDIVVKDHLAVLDYLMAVVFVDKSIPPFPKLSSHLGKRGDLAMIKYLYQNPLLRNQIEFTEILEESIKNHFNDVTQYLKDQGIKSLK